MLEVAEGESFLLSYTAVEITLKVSYCRKCFWLWNRSRCYINTVKGSKHSIHRKKPVLHNWTPVMLWCHNYTVTTLSHTQQDHRCKNSGTDLSEPTNESRLRFQKINNELIKQAVKHSVQIKSCKLFRNDKKWKHEPEHELDRQTVWKLFPRFSKVRSQSWQSFTYSHDCYYLSHHMTTLSP